MNMDNQTSCAYNVVVKWKSVCGGIAGAGQSPVLTIAANGGVLSYSVPYQRVIDQIVVTKLNQIVVLSTWSCLNSWGPVYVSNGCANTQIHFQANGGNNHRIMW